MTRELDAQVAELMGWVKVSVWRWCEPIDGFVWYWRLEDPEMARILTERDEWRITKDSDHRETGKAWCVGVPHYSTDIAAARKMEDTIETQKERIRYASCMRIVLYEDMKDPRVERDLWWALLYATPEQRCRAFLKMVQEKQCEAKD